MSRKLTSLPTGVLVALFLLVPATVSQEKGAPTKQAAEVTERLYKALAKADQLAVLAVLDVPFSFNGETIRNHKELEKRLKQAMTDSKPSDKPVSTKIEKLQSWPVWKAKTIEKAENEGTTLTEAEWKTLRQWDEVLSKNGWVVTYSVRLGDETDASFLFLRLTEGKARIVGLFASKVTTTVSPSVDPNFPPP